MECPIFNWVTNHPPAPEWTFYTNKHLEVVLETGIECGGTIGVTQNPNAYADIAIPAGKKMSFDWRIRAKLGTKFSHAGVATVWASSSGPEAEGFYEQVWGEALTPDDCGTTTKDLSGSFVGGTGVVTISVSFSGHPRGTVAGHGIELEITNCTLSDI